MVKKIYDITPPKVANKVQETVKSLGAKEAKKKRATKPAKVINKELTLKELSPKSQKAKRGFPLKEILIGLAVILFLLGIYFYNKLQAVQVEITPNLEEFTLADKITADKSAVSIDLQKKIIPLKVLEEIEESFQEFPATGSSSNDGKATGNITIYNKLSPANPLTLITGTHFLSDSGKYFVTLSRVTIPAMKGKTPGSVTVKVQAKEVGSEFNIGSSKFSVPKLSGTAYYYGIWGESTEDIKGGYTGKVKKVTKSDLEGAEDILTDTLLKKAESSLVSKVSGDEVLLDGAILKKVMSTSSDAKPDEVADKFNQSAKVKVLALVVSKQSLENFAKNSISSDLPYDKTLLEDSLSLQYRAGIVDFEKGIEEIDLQANIQTYYIMDLSALADLLKRKSDSQIKEIIVAQYGEKVSNIKVNFWPFWVTKAPKDIANVKVSLNFKK